MGCLGGVFGQLQQQKNVQKRDVFDGEAEVTYLVAPRMPAPRTQLAHPYGTRAAALTLTGSSLSFSAGFNDAHAVLQSQAAGN